MRVVAALVVLVLLGCGSGSRATRATAPATAAWASPATSTTTARSCATSTVVAHVTRGEVALRVVRADAACPPSKVRVERKVGRGPWKQVASPPVEGDPTEVVWVGRDVYIAAIGHIAGGAVGAFAGILHSADTGQSWTRIDDPCSEPGKGPEFVTWQLAAAPDAVVVLCVARGNDPHPFLLFSRDGGATFRSRRSMPDVAYLDLAAVSRLRISAAYVEGRSEGVLASDDGGVTWSRALTVSAPEGALSAVLDWSDAETGRATFEHRTWLTQDGGRTWSKLSLRPRPEG